MIKVPPYSIEAEESVLGSILIDREALLLIYDILFPEDFYDERNKNIYEAMIDLYKNNRPIDIITLSQKLDDLWILETIGGIEYLIKLTELVPTSTNIVDYAHIVKDKAVHRKLIRVWNEIISYGYDEAKSIEEILELSEKSLFSVTQIFRQNKLIPIKDILSQRYEVLAEIQEDPQKIFEQRLFTGFSSFDELIWGFKPGDMVILAARPSMGKTAFSLNIAQNIWFSWKTVAIFSLEMSKEQLTDRMISSTMGINSWKLIKWELEDEEFVRLGEALERLSWAHIYIDDTAMCSILDIKSKARRLKMESWLDLIIIDYLQLMTHSNSANRVQEISEISRGIKSLARELHIPIIAISQLSRAVESRTDKRPILSDLRESWSIEQDADIVVMLYREDYYDENTEKKGIVEVVVKKNRNGPTGTVELSFDRVTQRFYEIDTTREWI